MDDLVAFLKARLDEDERAPTPGREALDDLRFELKRGEPYWQHLASRVEDGLDIQTVAWEARVRREVAAKRAILARYEDCLARMEDPDYSAATARDQAREYEDFVLPNLAVPYANHPDYQQEWKP